MNIVYASDNNFVMQLGVSLVSLLRANRKAEEVNLYILDNGISEENRKRLSGLCGAYGRSLHFIDVSDFEERFQLHIAQTRWAVSTYLRLFLCSFLPHLDRIVYLDCDTLVCGPLQELWEYDLQGCGCAAVMDAISKAHKRNVGLEAEEQYFNAGVTLIDLAAWRKQAAEQSFIQYIGRCGGKVPYVDQGVINAVLRGNIACLPARCNVTSVLYDLPYRDVLTYRKPQGYYTEEEICHAKENPAVIHFTSSIFSLRPWIEGSRHSKTGLWLEYKAMSPWKDTPLWKDTRSAGKKAAVGIYHALPAHIAVKIAGFVHSNMKPAYEHNVI